MSSEETRKQDPSETEPTPAVEADDAANAGGNGATEAQEPRAAAADQPSESADGASAKPSADASASPADQPTVPTIGGGIAVLVETLRAESKQHYDRLLRTAADFENFKKRAKRDINDARVRAEDKSVLAFLPVIDNLERALDHAVTGAAAGAPEDEAATAAASLISGVRMVHKQFIDTLARFGISPVDAIGHPFDPEKHEALQQAPSTEHPKGTVIHELQRGYAREGKLVRAAMVIVSAGPPADAAAAPAADSDSDGGDGSDGGETSEAAAGPSSAEAPAADEAATDDKSPPEDEAKGGAEP